MRRKFKMPVTNSVKDSRFAEWLKAELRARNMTQADLCQLIGKNPSIINKLLRSGGSPRPSTVNAIADGLLLPREELYRVAGLLPTLSREGANWERVRYKYSLLSPENQAKFERFLDFEILEQRRKKASKQFVR
ncbi:MAG: helix-turn-helix transcriptional regulator [Anaerolineales bacterium]|jgi:transcriptional regulator with XRE-family HTH domain